MQRILSERLPADHPHQRQAGARFALLTFAAINLLNFADRYVPSSVKHLLQEDLDLTDPQTSLPVTGMILVYMVFSMIFGWLADKDLVDRRLILAGAIAFWSLATAVAGIAQDLVQLVFFRSLVGVGEAAYMAIAPAMISDFYPPAERNIAFTVFNLAMPLGGALGYGLGATLGGAFSWRVAFLAVGAPGLFVSGLVLFVNNPQRGISDGPLDPEKPVAKEGTLLQDVWQIISNPAYAFATAGMVTTSFAVGGFADWYGELLKRRTDVTVSSAGLVLGAATAIGGIGGGLLGSKAAQHFETRWRSAYFVVPAIFMLPGAALACVAVNFVEMKYLASFSITLAEVFMFTYTAPLSTISISVIPAELRARSAGLQIFLSHVLGDVISPPIVGEISEATGSLQLAMQLPCVMVLVSGFWWFAGGRCLEPLPSFSGEPDEGQVSFASVLSADPADSEKSRESTCESSDVESTMSLPEDSSTLESLSVEDESSD